MNKLRELIAKATCSPWHWDSDELKGVTPPKFRYRICTIGKTVTQWYYNSTDKTVAADTELICLLRNNADAIADLIYAAKAHISVLDGHTEIYGDKLFPKTSDMIRKSIAKLEETK